jgi:hypothetical protein
LSSSANHIFDITWGYSTGSFGTDGSALVQQAKKVNIYNEMSLILNTLDISGNIRSFDRDGEHDTNTADDMNETLFLNFTRLLAKDEIKKGSWRMSYFASCSFSGTTEGKPEYGGLNVLGDYNGINDYRINSPAGEYALLFTSSFHATHHGGNNPPVGHLYYQAAIAVITASIFQNEFGDQSMGAITGSVTDLLKSGTINQLADGLRYAIKNVQFNNTTELNSSIYFCRAHNTDFNFSSNPTYLSASEIIVKGNNPLADPVSYITTVGLYSPDNELLAVAKVSEPLKKTPSNEVTLRVRLDY